jgi:regulatory protein
MEPGKITALQAQKRNRERLNVYLDGQYAFSLALNAAVGLSLGQQLSAEDIAHLQTQDDYEKAKQRALNFITYRPRSISEVRKNLRGKEVDDTIIDQVITRLCELELLDDAAFGRYWVEQREAFKPRSPMALRQELQQKGLDREVIDEVLAELDETAAARRAAEQQAGRWTHLDKESFYQKMGGFLQRRGFRYATVREVTDEIWQNLKPESET